MLKKVIAVLLILPMFGQTLFAAADDYLPDTSAFTAGPGVSRVPIEFVEALDERIEYYDNQLNSLNKRSDLKELKSILKIIKDDEENDELINYLITHPAGLSFKRAWNALQGRYNIKIRQLLRGTPRSKRALRFED